MISLRHFNSRPGMPSKLQVRGEDEVMETIPLKCSILFLKQISTTNLTFHEERRFRTCASVCSDHLEKN
ncbi:hypothetical protein T10_6728 [Trichinella papuae]|uniref:Uncharacterized protein n=1 Tax=Trichinella papuae TaxID=268474 RepID=A0A0V1M5D8_9BILA|nr:hypothetical protein T10_6728 [Trichinella papuae]